MIPMTPKMKLAIVTAVVMGPIPIPCPALLLAVSKSTLQNPSNRYNGRNLYTSTAKILK